MREENSSGDRGSDTSSASECLSVVGENLIVAFAKYLQHGSLEGLYRNVQGLESGVSLNLKIRDGSCWSTRL